MAYRAPARLAVDGKLDEPSWAAAPWSDAFVDIEGDSSPRPRFRTRAKMLWDDEYFYVAAEMEEPDLWGTLTARDSVIFHDNDFEVFIDPDGDTHAYYELEVNALGTPWDLMLIKPYRDGGPAINGWDIAGLAVGLDVRGTINRPGDRDDGWTRRDRDAVADPSRGGARGEGCLGPATDGASTSRACNGRWMSRTVAIPSDSSRAARIRCPRTTGCGAHRVRSTCTCPNAGVSCSSRDVQAGGGTEAFVEDPNERVKWALRRLYYRQRAFRARTGGYATALDPLNVSDVRVEGLDFRPVMHATPSLYEIVAPGFAGATVHISQDGRVWVTK